MYAPERNPRRDYKRWALVTKRGPWVLVMMIMRPALGQVPALDASRAFRMLEAQCAFGPRIPGSEGHAACLDFLLQTLKATGARLQTQSFPYRSPWTGQTVRAVNVIASFGTQKERILLCTHWDTRPVADQDPLPENRTRPVPGANDGASGTAVLLEIAHILSHHPPPLGVDLVFFDAEDGGKEGESLESWCLGSQYFSKHLPIPRPQYAILIDMIGDKNLTIPKEGFSHRYAPALVDRIWARAKSLGLDVFLDEPGYEVIDDHVPLLQAGIPAVNLIDFDYPYWHTVMDTPHQCSPKSLEAVGRLLLSLIFEP